MTTHDQILETLRAQQPRSVEDLALSTLALRHHSANPRHLLATQLPNGAWPNALATAIPNVYATSLALIALAHTARHEAAHRAFAWLDNIKGREGHWLWRWKFHWFDRQVKFDPARYGWPWVEGTVSWVAPTALAVVAHRAWRRSSPRLPRAAAMLLDRACPSGGWNAGNSEAFGVPLAAHPDFTAMGLLALRARGLHAHPIAARAAACLIERLATAASAYSLAWAILALRNHEDAPIEALQHRLRANLAAHIETPANLALAALALEQPPFHLLEPQP